MMDAAPMIGATPMMDAAAGATVAVRCANAAMNHAHGLFGRAAP